jgi:hypothetical protein
MDAVEKARLPAAVEHEQAPAARRAKQKEKTRLELLKAKLEAAGPDRALPKVYSETCVF